MRPPARPTRQRGAALLMAMVILTLVTTLASGMVWQHWRGVQVEIAERARAQAAWILVGALDWARLILRENARVGGPDHLGEPWAVPLAEARLSTFLAADRSNPADDGDLPQAFLSGSIEDAQARYNVRNVVSDGKVVDEELKVLRRLCEAAGVGAATADRLAQGLAEALQADAGALGAVEPRRFDDLQWLGLDPLELERLRPLLTLLPGRVATPVNVNTAPAAVLAAVVEGLDLGSAQRLVETRQRSPLRDPQEILNFLPPEAPRQLRGVATQSAHFVVRGRLRLDDRVLEEESLVRREGQLEMVTVWRERVSRVAASGS